MTLDVLLLKVLQHEVGVIVFQVVKQYWFLKKNNFLRSSPSHPNNIYVFCPLFWVSVDHYIFGMPETGICH